MWIMLSNYIILPKEQTLNFSNPPCYYYVGEKEIKLFGLNNSINHSISVLVNQKETQIIVFDKTTDPPTKIPLCKNNTIQLPKGRGIQ